MLQASQNMNMVVSEYLWGIIQGAETSSQNTYRSEDLKYIRKRKDGRWEYRRTIENKRVSAYASTLKQIIQLKKHLESNQVLIEYKVRPSAVTVIDYVTNWLQTYKLNNVSKSSQNMYLSALSKLQELTQPINKVKTTDLQKVVNKIEQPSIRKYTVFLLKQAFKLATIEEVVQKNVAEYVEVGKIEEEKGRSLTLAEQRILLANLHKYKIGKLILFYLLTGCRPGEGVKIKKSDINFEKNVIEVKGTKTKNAKRFVLISEKLKLLLQEEYNNIFCYSYDYMQKQFAKITAELSIENAPPHSLRHTFSTNLYYLGVPDKERQAQLGHASIVMTNDIYTHLDPTITKNDILELYGEWYPYK